MRHAISAYQDLTKSGINPEEISLLSRYEVMCHPGDREVATAVTAGGAGGAVIGGLAGLVVGLGVFTIPGLGQIAASGTLASILGSALAGAGAGGIGGGLLFNELLKLSIPKDEARLYEEGLNCGSVLLTVHVAENQIPQVGDILENNRANNIETIENMRNAGMLQKFDKEIDPEETNVFL
ncbi:MAG: hypothetical protein R3264_02465 [Anaerolineae bacterium]|nr:hypothetical protein [Anaerolineae bacterium]